MNLKVLFRQLGRSGFLSSVRFFSLLIGFIITIVIVVWVTDELSYDQFWKNKDRIYRVSLEQYQNGELQLDMASNYRGVTDLMMEELPEVEGRVRLHRDMITVFTPDAQIQDVKMFYADTCVFDILNRKILARESSVLFPDLRSVVISESLSKKIFGDKNPIGRSLKLNEGWEFYVSAIFEDIPANSHMDFDLLMTVPSLRYYLANFNNRTSKLDEDKPFEYFEPGPYDKRSWGKWYGYSYILVKDGTDVQTLRSKVDSLISREILPSMTSSVKINLLFQPITSIHLHSDLAEEMKINSSLFKVYAMMLVALIVMIISILNFINLSVIDFYNHSFNSAIRMIFGAKVRDLLKFRFYKEFLIGLTAGICSFIVAYYALKVLVPGSAPGRFTFILIAVIIVLSALLTLIAPLLHFRSNNLREMLKRNIISGTGGIITRKLLVTIQFAISIFLIAATIVIFYQLRFIQHKDPGFVPGSIIYSYSPMTMNARPDIQEKLRVFRSRMDEIAGVRSFCTSSSVPGKDFLMHSENVARANEEPDKQTYFQILNVDQEYLRTYKLNLIAGRDFMDSNHYPGDEVILNQLAARKIGFINPEDAPGEVIKVDGKNYVVCGVVRDFHHLSLKQQLTPVIIFKSLKWRYAVGYYSFRIAPEYIRAAIPLIEKAWVETYPGERFLYKYLEVNYYEQYLAEENFGNSLSLGSIMAILISCLGLFGFARYSAAKRIKEIGVRKTFGASSSAILILFNKEVLQMVGFAAIFGLPLSWFLANKWLQNFAYRINASLWMFVAALALTALIAVSATFYISLKSSRANPKESLRNE